MNTYPKKRAFLSGLGQGLLVALGAMLVIAAVAPSSPPVRLVAGSGMSIVTNALNYFTLTATNSGGGTNTLIAGSGITITTNAANSWTVAATNNAVRTIVVNTLEVSGGGDWGTMQDDDLPATYLSRNGDTIRFIYWGSISNEFSIKGWRLNFGGEEVFENEVGEASGEGAKWRLEGSITRVVAGVQKSEAVFTWGLPNNSLEVATVYIQQQTNYVDTSTNFHLLLEGIADMKKVGGRIYYEPAP